MRVEQERQLIDEAIQESRAPRRVASGRTVIAASLGRNNKSYLVLANGDELTRAGESQFGPVCEHWCGCAVPAGALENSQMLWDMCQGNKLVLTENKRSDAKLFDFYTNLGDDLQSALRRAKQLFPRTKREAAYTLTMSHSRRVAVNKLRNRQEYMQKFAKGQGPPQAVLVKAPPPTRSGNQPQDMWLWPGLQLIGAGGLCKKGLFYEVAEVDGNIVHLTCGLRLTHEQAARSLRLSYGLTFASCQGLTLRGVVRLETDSPNFTLKHLYVGVSRATAADLVEIA